VIRDTTTRALAAEFAQQVGPICCGMTTDRRHDKSGPPQRNSRPGPMTPGSQARQALAGPGTALPVARAGIRARPGLYAIHGGAETWEQLGLGRPPDDRPLYVGKAERSLAGRDIRQHFGTGMTGSSTLRRSIAALLRTRLGLSAVARNPGKPGHFANYALAEPGEVCLTSWMETQLRIAAWVPDDPIDLGTVERELLQHWQPPLNLAGVSTPWTAKLQAARRVMAEEARRSAG